MIQNQPINNRKLTEDNAYSFSSKENTSKFKINKTMSNNVNVEATKQVPQTASRYVINKLSYKSEIITKNTTNSVLNLDPKNFKVNNNIISKPKNFERKTSNKFKLVKNRYPLVNTRRPSIETSKLLALRRKKFIRTQNKLFIQKSKLTSLNKSVSSRFKLQKVPTKPVNKAINYLANFNKNNKYKINNCYKLNNSMNDKSICKMASVSITASAYPSQKQYFARLSINSISLNL